MAVAPHPNPLPASRGSETGQLVRSFDIPLPIDAVLDELAGTLARNNAAVLVAPPGAGKTTRVPLALLDAPWLAGRKIIVLEPRRIAARASAERMARSLGERAGETVGYRVRFGSKVSRATRIEVVTEGIFSRQILDDPELTDVAAVLFDEFHERSLDADLGLALARDAQTGLREDLRILVMSATLDGARIAKMLGDAPVVASEGRAFAVETRYLGRKADLPLERQMADAVAMALRADPGSVLAFLPGAAEIRRTQTLLSERIHDAAIEIVPLFGALDAAVQDRAIAPAPQGRRKVVLATSIAETSLTIEGVRIVVDSGVARVPRYEPDIGLTRLETVRASRAAVDQRRGRAGRTEPGVCYRLWDEPQTASLAPYTQPEILSADLSSLVLDLAQWGVGDPATLAFLDPPPAPALKEARSLLRELGALDGDGRITAEGNSLRALALPPRLARMIVDSHRLGGGETAADIAAVLTERGLGGDSVDLDVRLDQFRRDRSQRAGSARSLARRWAAQVALLPPPLRGRAGEGEPQRQSFLGKPPPPIPPRKGEGSGESLHGDDKGAAELTTGVMLALAFPDRVARNRGQGSFVLANGRGAAVDPASALARAPYIAVAELDGHGGAGAHSAGGADRTGGYRSAFRRSDRDRGRGFVRSRSDGVAGAAQAHPAGHDAVGSPACVDAIGGDRAGAGRRPDRRRHRTTAMVEIGQAVARPCDVPAQGRGRCMARFVGSRPCGAARRLAGADPPRQDFGEGFVCRRAVGGADDAAAMGIARAAGARGADPFRGADRHHACDRLRGRAGADHRGQIAGTVRVDHASVDCERHGAAGAGIVVAGAPAGPGDARPAGLLARQLRRGSLRSARTLPQASLAGRSGARDADAAGEAAGNVRTGRR